VRAVLAAILVICVGVAGAGCDDASAPFRMGSFQEVEGAIGSAGLRICSRQRLGIADAPGATAARVYGVARDCATREPGTNRVFVTAFEDRDARDLALQRLGTQSFARRRPHAAAWTWDRFVIEVSGDRDHDVERALADALDRTAAE
jgi:hypothetical protein